MDIVRRAPIKDWKLRTVYNARMGWWSIIHNQTCAKGETSVISTILTSEDPVPYGEEEQIARRIIACWNAFAGVPTEDINGHR